MGLWKPYFTLNVYVEIFKPFFKLSFLSGANVHREMKTGLIKKGVHSVVHYWPLTFDPGSLAGTTWFAWINPSGEDKSFGEAEVQVEA